MEVYEEPKFTKEITGGVLGGLLLLILVTVGLVKVINTPHTLTGSLFVMRQFTDMTTGHLSGSCFLCMVKVICRAEEVL